MLQAWRPPSGRFQSAEGPRPTTGATCFPCTRKSSPPLIAALAALRSGSQISETKPHQLPQVGFTLQPGAGEVFTVTKGASLYSDQDVPIASVAPELDGLKGIRVSAHQETPIHFRLDKPAQILVGFFKSNSRKQVNVSPDTEQWNILLPDGVAGAKGVPISVWAKPLPAGENDLDLGKGAYVVLGFIPEDTHVTPHVNFDPESKQPPNLDWLFED